MNWVDFTKKQPKVARILKNSIANNRVSHAYIFEGEKGVSKKEAAVLFAQILYCESIDAPCDDCENCRRIKKMSHGNVYLIEPDGNTIKKEQVQLLQHEFARTSLEEGPKIYIINHIERMSIGAANSLLKFLEEPLSESYAILITDNVNLVLPTIISRSQVISFKPSSSVEMSNELVNRGFEQSLANTLSIITNDLDEAIGYSENENILAMIDMAEGIFSSLAKKDESILLYFNHYSNQVDFRDKSNVIIFLRLINSVYNDIINYKLNDKYEIRFLNLKEDIDQLAKQNMSKIYDQIDKVFDTERRANYNVNIPLLFDDLFIYLDRSYFNESSWGNWDTV